MNKIVLLGKLIKDPELKTIENQQDKLYELLEQGIYTNAIFIKRNTALAEKRKKITSEIENLKTSIPNSINYEEKIVQLSNALNTLQNPDIHPKIKNEFLKVIINNIYYIRHMFFIKTIPLKSVIRKDLCCSVTFQT